MLRRLASASRLERNMPPCDTSDIRGGRLAGCASFETRQNRELWILSCSRSLGEASFVHFFSFTVDKERDCLTRWLFNVRRNVRRTHGPPLQAARKTWPFGSCRARLTRLSRTLGEEQCGVNLDQTIIIKPWKLRRTGCIPLAAVLEQANVSPAPFAGEKRRYAVVPPLVRLQWALSLLGPIGDTRQVLTGNTDVIQLEVIIENNWYWSFMVRIVLPLLFYSYFYSRYLKGDQIRDTPTINIFNICHKLTARRKTYTWVSVGFYIRGRILIWLYCRPASGNGGGK